MDGAPHVMPKAAIHCKLVMCLPPQGIDASPMEQGHTDSPRLLCVFLWSKDTNSI